MATRRTGRLRLNESPWGKYNRITPPSSEENQNDNNQTNTRSSIEILCPQKHRTVRKKSSHPNFICDICGTRINLREYKNGCQICNWDICQSCSDCYQRLSTSVSTFCRSGHKTSLQLTPNGTYACDVCNTRAPKGYPMHGCRACNWDTCLMCLRESEDADCCDATDAANIIESSTSSSSSSSTDLETVVSDLKSQLKVSEERIAVLEGRTSALANLDDKSLDNLEQELRISLQAVEKRKNVLVCVVCLDEDRSRVSRSCGHACVCDSCYKDLDSCPICREKVTSWDPFHLC